MQSPEYETKRLSHFEKATYSKHSIRISRPVNIKGKCSSRQGVLQQISSEGIFKERLNFLFCIVAFVSGVPITSLRLVDGNVHWQVEGK